MPDSQNRARAGVRVAAWALKLAILTALVIEGLVLSSYYGRDPLAIRYTVSATRPGSGRFEIAAEITGGSRLIVFLRPLARPEETRLQGLGAYAPSGEKLATRWVHGNLAIFAGFRPRIILRYAVVPGILGRHGHQGALASEFGIVAGRFLFFVPRRANDLTAALVRFVLPPGWQTVSAWEPREGPWLDPRIGGLLLESLERSTLAFGHWCSSSVRTDANRLEVHAWDGWPADRVERVTSRAVRLFRVLETLFHFRLANRFVVVFTPPAPDGRGIIGDYWSSGLGMDMDDSPRAWGLFAHRVVHVLNRDRPYGMHLLPRDPYLVGANPVNWFNEGVASFLEVWALVQAGIEPSDRRFDEPWQDYLRRHAPLSKFFVPLARERDVRDAEVVDYLHYRKAPLVVQNLDYRLRAASAGAKSVPDFVSQLYAKYGQHRAPVPFYDELARYADFDIAPFFDRVIAGDDILLPLWDEALARSGTGPRDVAAWIDGEAILADTGMRNRVGRGEAESHDIARLIDEKLLERELRARDPEALPSVLILERPWLPEASAAMLARKVREALCRALYGDKSDSSERRLDVYLAERRRRAALRPGRPGQPLPSDSGGGPSERVVLPDDHPASASDRALTSAESTCALRIGRAALSQYVREGRVLDARALPVDTLCALAGPLLERRAVFVTLRRAGKVRGCVGTYPPASAALWRGIVESADRAARHDERYPAVTADELESLELEISVLRPPRPLARGAPIQLGNQALMIVQRGRRALLLPWAPIEAHWDRETTLAQLVSKAGLAPDAWEHGAQLFALETQAFKDAPETAPH